MKRRRNNFHDRRNKVLILTKYTKAPNCPRESTNYYLLHQKDFHRCGGGTYFRTTFVLSIFFAADSSESLFASPSCRCSLPPVLLLSPSPPSASASILGLRGGGGWYSRARSRVRRSAASWLPKILEKSSFLMVPNNNTREDEDDDRWRGTIDVPGGENASTDRLMVVVAGQQSRNVHVFRMMIGCDVFCFVVYLWNKIWCNMHQ